MNNKMVKTLSALGLALACTSVQVQAAPIFDSGIPSGWTCTGNCGTSAADGVVGLAPDGGAKYGWVSTNGGVSGVGLAGVGGSGNPTDGSVLRSNLFSANAAEVLKFSFNFVTTDGAGFADYAWARLLDASNNLVALLFTARTAPTGSIVPGFSMPAPTVTLNPTNVPIIAGGPAWSPLGGDTGRCYNSGCGYTGWINTSFTLAASGNYQLEFGVTNWNDTSFDTGMAIDGLTIGGRVITDPNPVSAPATFALFGLGFAGLMLRRRK